VVRPALDIEHQRLQEAADRAYNFFFSDETFKQAVASRTPNNPPPIDQTIDNETLLVEACESLALAIDMLHLITKSMDGPLLKRLLMMKPVIQLSERVVRRVLANERLPA